MMLPIGYDNFQEIIAQKLDFVDKSLFIKDILEDKGTKVIVITRPRRFGKTMNLSMLHHFLSPQVDGKATQNLFHHLHIEDYPECMKFQGQFPVIFLSFKDVKAINYLEAQESFTKLLSDLYLKHDDLLLSSKLNSRHKENFKKILKKNASLIELTSALTDLTYYLYLHYEKKPWLLIDEYDTPIQAGYLNQYYSKMIHFMRGLLGPALKSNSYLERAVVTGILRVAKESLFSGVNNLKVYSILKEKYSTYFGFTPDEIDTLLRQSHLTDQAQNIKDWYNGYTIGSTVIYNPWSIVNCIQEQGRLIPYWVNTSDNQLIKELLQRSSLAFKTQFEELMQDKTTERFIDDNLTFIDLNQNPSALWSLLFMSGYLKALSSKDTHQGTLATLAIPNQEVRNFYRQMVEQWLSHEQGIEWYNTFLSALLEGKVSLFKEQLNLVLLHIVSIHDVAQQPEAFFHGLLLGFIVSLHENYDIKSNRESGLGRFDILLIPREPRHHKPGVVLELKVQQEGETLLQAAQRALEQIESKHYQAELKHQGLSKIISIGIGFKGKACEVVSHVEG